ncbi:MAG: peptidase U32 family protein [Clostridium fessum]
MPAPIRAVGNTAVVEETRPGEYMPVYENERGTYIFNSSDLCMIEHIPELIDAGIDSFKIEGRMKTALYVATVARTYRKAIDDYKKDPALYQKNMEWYKEEIGKCTYREFTTGFTSGKPTTDSPDLRQQHLRQELHLSRHGRSSTRRMAAAASGAEE